MKGGQISGQHLDKFGRLARCLAGRVDRPSVARNKKNKQYACGFDVQPSSQNRTQRLKLYDQGDFLAVVLHVAFYAFFPHLVG